MNWLAGSFGWNRRFPHPSTSLKSRNACISHCLLRFFTLRATITLLPTVLVLLPPFPPLLLHRAALRSSMLIVCHTIWPATPDFSALCIGFSLFTRSKLTNYYFFLDTSQPIWNPQQSLWMIGMTNKKQHNAPYENEFVDIYINCCDSSCRELSACFLSLFPRWSCFSITVARQNLLLNPKAWTLSFE